MALKSVVKEIPGITYFDEIPNKVSALQKEILLNMRKIGDITENLSRLEVSLEMANIGKQQAENESALSREKVKELLLEVVRLKKMVST
ncbi:hypothetical protein ZOSMA_9G00350 [Zostera marina]|uniref:Uncharacterized protein n=1 Tax=Zostera marina TaxID=29655 RepID=A0A0K9NIX6_ZOSMR|nr:hypothetical protein ZOSMA_9G00350 [Zostera marina]